MNSDDLTNKKTMTKTNTMTKTKTMTMTFREHPQRVTLEACDLMRGPKGDQNRLVT